MFFEDGEDFEVLDIPILITKTDEWYDELKSINESDSLENLLINELPLVIENSIQN